MSDHAILPGAGGKADELITEARERWGEEWFLKIHMDSDGDADVWAVHTAEVVADGVAIRDILTHTTGGRVVEHRALYDLEEVVADVDTDE